MKLNKFVFFTLLLTVGPKGFGSGAGDPSDRSIHGGSYISEKPIPYLYGKKEDDPGRNLPMFGLGLGDPFLSNGNLSPGFTLPTGAVWQPRLWFFGESRTALHSYDLGPRGPHVSEWATRFDLFANLQLTGTERILLGIEPFHRGSSFLGERFEPNASEGWTNPTNARIRTLFFEGDLAELFPNFDYTDKKGLDIGFSIGRQNVIFQDGLLLNDNMDGVGLTKNNLRFGNLEWLTNLRLTMFWGVDEVSRDDNLKDPSAKLYGFFTAMDTIWSTFEVDLVYVDSNIPKNGDVIAGGISSIKRLFDRYSWTMRALGSTVANGGAETRKSDDGTLLFSEFSFSPRGTHNVLYINGFWGIDHYTSASRDVLAGGPLGRTGILFAARGVGSYPSPLSNRAQDALGSVIGYQMFFSNKRQNVIIETGIRRDVSDVSPDNHGLALQWQRAFKDNYILQTDGFITEDEAGAPGYGARTEFLIKF